VTVRVSAEVGRGTAASVRPRALENALISSVAMVAARYTWAEERAQMPQALKSVLSRASSFVSRYSIVEEGVEEGVYRMKLNAEVERDSLLAALAGQGFKVAPTGSPPRILVAQGPGTHSKPAFETIAAIFTSEGLPAFARAEPVDPPAALTAIAKAQGYHVGLTISVSIPKPPEEELMGPPTDPDNPPVPSSLPTPPEGPVRVEMNCEGMLTDAATGLSLGREELTMVGEGPDEAAAAADGAQRGAEELAQVLMGDLVKSGWRIGDKTEDLELDVVGIDSPGLVPELTDAMTQMAEIKSVTLDRIEGGFSAWKVRGVNPGGDWLPVLARLKLSKGALSWKKNDGPAGKAYEGRWSKP